MLVEWLYELKESIDRHGLRWGVAITIYALIRKERRNIRLDKRDDAIFQNQKLIMDHLGIGDQWRGHLTMSSEDLQSFKRLSFSLHRGIQSASQLKRGVRKVQISRVWLTGVVAYYLGIIGMKWGITFGNDTADLVAGSIITVILPLIVAWWNKTRMKKDTKYPDSSSSV